MMEKLLILANHCLPVLAGIAAMLIGGAHAYQSAVEGHLLAMALLMIMSALGAVMAYLGMSEVKKELDR